METEKPAIATLHEVEFVQIFHKEIITYTQPIC